MPRIVLASQSTSRKRLLVDAGLSPEIIVSNVDEETDFFNAMSPEDMVIALAISKAHTVREMIDYPAIIIGCDSTFDVDGISFGKPGTPNIARQRARTISGRSGLLHTGHCIIDTEKGVEIADRVTTKVTFSHLSDEEIEDLVNFIENGLYDPDLFRYVPDVLPSGNCFPNADILSQIDQGCIQ